MTREMLKTAILLLLLAGVLVHILPAEELPDSPRPQLKTRSFVISREDPNVVHNAPSMFKGPRDPLKTWHFWTGTGVLLGATLYDQQKTLDGLKTTGCVEANGNNTRASLMAHDLPVVAGITVVKYLIEKYSRAPWWGTESMDAVAATVHIHDGLKWNNCK